MLLEFVDRLAQFRPTRHVLGSAQAAVIPGSVGTEAGYAVACTASTNAPLAYSLAAMARYLAGLPARGGRSSAAHLGTLEPDSRPGGGGPQEHRRADHRPQERPVNPANRRQGRHRPGEKLLSRPARFAASVVLALASGCRGPGANSLVVYGRSPIVSVDPLTNDDYYARSVFTNVFDPLVMIDAELHLVPALALSWSNPSEVVWRFELRRGVLFHDGQELKASDVKASLDRARSAGSWLAADLGLVTEVRASAPFFVEIETRVPVPLLLNHLAEVMVLPAGRATAEASTGTGPYRIRSFVVGEEAILERFDGSWRGRPRWDSAAFRADPDGRSRLERLLRGNADLIEAPPIGDPLQLPANAGIELVERPAAQIAVLGLNAQRRPNNPFERREARRAVSLTLDRSALVRDALAGSGAPATQLAVPGVFGHVPGLPPVARDLSAAPAALPTAGSPNGIQSPLLFSEPDRRLAEAVAGQARDAGIRFRLEELAWHELDERLRARSSPAHIFFATFPTGDAAELLMDLHTPTRDGLFGVYNFSGYSDPELDDLLEHADLAMDPRRRIDLLERA